MIDPVAVAVPRSGLPGPPRTARRWKRGAYAVCCLGSISASVGCIPPEPRGLDSPDPSARLAAISEAGARHDDSAIPNLIEQLESNDPAARMLSIRALERITGETLGYDHSDPWWVREKAVLRWRKWAADRGLLTPKSGGAAGATNENPLD